MDEESSYMEPQTAGVEVWPRKFQNQSFMDNGGTTSSQYDLNPTDTIKIE